MLFTLVRMLHFILEQSILMWDTIAFKMLEMINCLSLRRYILIIMDPICWQRIYQEQSLSFVVSQWEWQVPPPSEIGRDLMDFISLVKPIPFLLGWFFIMQLTNGQCVDDNAVVEKIEKKILCRFVLQSFGDRFLVQSSWHFYSVFLARGTSFSTVDISFGAIYSKILMDSWLPYIVRSLHFFFIVIAICYPNYYSWDIFL